MNELNNRQGLSRRTMVKGAAWSVPVIAVAAATPMAAASTTAGAFDVGVTGTCSGDFKAAGLGSAVLNGLTGALGLEEAHRNFTVTAVEGTVPTGTQFSLNDGGLLNLGLLTVTGALDVNALNIIRLGDGAVGITLQQDLEEGQSFTIDLLSGLADVKVASTMTLSLVGDDTPSATPAPNSATVSTAAGSTVTVPLVGVSVALQVCG